MKIALTGAQDAWTRELLGRLFAAEGAVPADRLFQDFCRTKRLNSTNRRLVSEAFFTFLRQYWRSREVAESEDVQAVYEAWRRGAPEKVGSSSARANLSPELWGLFQESFGETALAEALAFQIPAPCDVRVNTFAGFTKSAVVRELCAEGIVTDELPLEGLRLLNRPALGHVGLYREGAFEVQEFGSQAVVGLCPVQPGMRVLDYCAGGGGKTLALLNGLVEKGRVRGEVVATDIDARRLEAARRRFARIRNFPKEVVRVVDFQKVQAGLSASFDLVVVDVPCSGLGTLRRNPDKAIFLTAAEVTRYTTLQGSILDQAARFVRPGGTLAYVTCSILRCENETVVEGALARHADLTSLQVPWYSVFQTPMPPRFSCFGLQLSPRTTQTDGFFVAFISKK